MKVKLDKVKVKELFEKYDHQADVMIELYKMVYPEWDFIEKMDSFPTINKSTAEYLCMWFRSFDHKHHPDVMAGGIWLNNGFSSLNGDDLPDWTVERCGFTWNKKILPMAA